MWVWHPESIPSSVSLVSLARLIWEPSPLQNSEWISVRTLWTWGAVAYPEPILASAGLRSWICSLTPCRSHANWWQIRDSWFSKFQIGTLKRSNRAQIAVGVGAHFERGHRAPSHWSSSWVYPKGNTSWCCQYRAVDTDRCKSEILVVIFLNWRASLGIRTDNSGFGIRSWIRLLVGFG